jgi:hypothetical protein
MGAGSRTPAAVEPDSELNAAIERWRRIVAEHVRSDSDRRRCARCGAYWPCWEHAYAREQLIVNGAG